jgi:hypothetical protein
MEMLYVFGVIICLVISIALIVSVFNIARNTRITKDILLWQKKEQIAQFPKYVCKHCGFRTKENEEYCQKCDKNSAGEIRH